MYAPTTYVEHASTEIDAEMNTQLALATPAVDQTWTSTNNRVAVPYTVETMTADVTPLKDKPLWPLSSYGPSKYEPVVINGLDESPDELRLKAVTALKAGTIDDYTKYEGERTAVADQIYTNARNNVRQLYELALKVSAQFQASASAPSSSASAFTTSAPSTFGTSSMPSAFGGTTTTAFGKPALGQPAFGQTGFGGSTSSTSPFSQGTQRTSAFGAHAQPVSAFTQPIRTPSAFGQPAQITSTFDQPAQPSSAFGQPSAIGATTQPTSAFAQPSTQPRSVFGQPSQPSSAFGQPPQPTSAFGHPSQLTSAFAQPPSTTSAFSQPSQPAFGHSSLIKPASGAFGGSGSGGFSAFASQPSGFASATTPSGSAAGTTPSPSVFGSTPPVQSAFGTASSVPKSVFGMSQPAPPGTSSFGSTLSVPAAPSTSSAVGVSPSASSPMTVTPSGEKPTLGVPDFASAKAAARVKPGADRYLDLLPSDYNEIIPADVMAAFADARFEWGKIPDWIPPAEVR